MPASIVEVIFREIREFSEGIVFLDQMPSEISRTALANTYTTIALNLKGKQDVATMSAAMLLQDDQPLALGSMEIGKAIVKLQGRIKEPFMIRVPEMKIPPAPVDDETLRQAMRPLIRQNDNVHEEKSPVLLTGAELGLLKDIAVAPKSGIVARYTRLQLERKAGRQSQALAHGSRLYRRNRQPDSRDAKKNASVDRERYEGAFGVRAGLLDAQTPGYAYTLSTHEHSKT